MPTGVPVPGRAVAWFRARLTGALNRWVEGLLGLALSLYVVAWRDELVGWLRGQQQAVPNWLLAYLVAASLVPFWGPVRQWIRRHRSGQSAMPRGPLSDEQIRNLLDRARSIQTAGGGGDRQKVSALFQSTLGLLEEVYGQSSNQVSELRSTPGPRHGHDAHTAAHGALRAVLADLESRLGKPPASTE